LVVLAELVRRPMPVGEMVLAVELPKPVVELAELVELVVLLVPVLLLLVQRQVEAVTLEQLAKEALVQQEYRLQPIVLTNS
jgi:hypothetical protein